MESANVPVVPVVDMEEPGAARALGKAARADGIALLVGHGVPADLVARCQTLATAFFDLPADDKLAVSAAGGLRGYQPAEDGEDEKEWYFCTTPAGLGAPLEGVNRWPRRPAGFEDALVAYLRCLIALGQRLMSLLAVDLGLPADRFARDFDEGTIGALRLLRYPPASATNRLGANEHTDRPALALLATNGVPGLEYKQAGAWRGVPHVEGALVFQIGELMTRWTSGAYHANVHRVVNGAAARQSMAFFLQPRLDARIACLETCEPARHPPITYRDYLREWLAGM